MRETSAETRAAVLPSGTVTFLFTDVEGSTQRWEAHREAMAEAMQRHDRLMRRAIEAHRGYVFKTIGDAFCAAFPTAPDAVAAALTAQRAISAEDFEAVGELKVRMAIHAGHAQERDGDYFGPAVNRVARLLGVGYGGQVLMSGAAADLAMGDLPKQVALRDLGPHRLKDLTQPEQIYQVVAPDLQQKFFPLRSLEALPNNLPLQLTSFVGRDRDIAECKALLSKVRLLTLVGTGGVGKTRLSLQAGADLLDEFEDGVWFAELAPLTSGELVAATVAAIFGVAEAGERPVLDALVQYLKNRHALLIFDNCEHVVADAARTIDAILHHCPRVRIIASSREGLAIAGEDVLRVASLATPSPQAVPSASEALQYGAVALFVDRATAATKSFKLTDANAQTVAEICRQLDGIPFAIELAAGRTTVLGVEQLAAKLTERFRILTGGSRTALPRQQTMRALIDWSHDLLTPNEQIVFRRLAVFAGGCTLEAASEICADETIESWDILDLISSLVGKSLIVAELEESAPRYRFLESTRQYAVEKLEKSGEADRTRQRHAEYFLQIAKRAEETWETTPTAAWVATLEVELDNFRNAIDWAIHRRHDPVLGPSLVATLQQLWAEVELTFEGLTRVDAALSVIDERTPPELIARLHLLRGTMLGQSQLYDQSMVPALEARAAFERIGDRYGVACAQRQIGNAFARARRSDEAIPLLEAALATFRELGAMRRVAQTLQTIGMDQLFRGEHVQAEATLEGALAIARARADRRTIGVLLNHLAESAFAAGNVPRAIGYGREALAIESHRSDLQPSGLSNLAAYLLAHNEPGEIEEARRLLTRGIRIAMETQRRVLTGIFIQHFASIAALDGDMPRAVRLAGYCTHSFATLGWMREMTEQILYDRIMEIAGASLDDETIAQLAKHGATLTEDRAVEEALRSSA